MQHKSLSAQSIRSTTHSDFAQWRMLPFHKCDLVIAWTRSEQHQRHQDSVKGLSLHHQGAFHCQMKSDSWEKTQHQLIGLKWEQKDLCIMSFHVATAGSVIVHCPMYCVDAQGRCSCNTHFWRMLFKYVYCFMLSLSHINSTFANEASRLYWQVLLWWLQNLRVCWFSQAMSCQNVDCEGRSTAGIFENVHQ